MGIKKVFMYCLLMGAIHLDVHAAQNALLLDLDGNNQDPIFQGIGNWVAVEHAAEQIKHPLAVLIAGYEAIGVPYQIRIRIAALRYHAQLVRAGKGFERAQEALLAGFNFPECYVHEAAMDVYKELIEQGQSCDVSIKLFELCLFDQTGFDGYKFKILMYGKFCQEITALLNRAIQNPNPEFRINALYASLALFKKNYSKQVNKEACSIISMGLKDGHKKVQLEAQRVYGLITEKSVFLA